MEITNVTEYKAIAKEKLPKMVYDYYASGAEDQWTLQENINASLGSWRREESSRRGTERDAVRGTEREAVRDAE
ncbi:hypothetical protein F2Q69_00036127 [Brassica cretica]|uniref:FMN-dependent dehydrogenase domain-containing protein n=2 Tax=Brassica cretica TaxID=69181 RepID=A0ABQ7BN17_BRACR|nr:hypothetical protein DY000_02040658 [Brassica cretica]KAF3598966.1 hypothetical protein F2Q69_00036127 [Brassica cretica]